MRFSDRLCIKPILVALFLGAGLASWHPVIARSLPEVQRLMKQGRYPQALEQVNAYLTAHGRDAQGRFYKGLILAELNRGNEAIAVFTRLTEDYPELPEPYNNLAVLYAQQKQYDRARLALEKAIRTHPAYAVAYENLGDVYARLASQAYDRALQLDSANAAAQSKLALISDLVSAPGRSAPPARGGIASSRQQQPRATVTTTVPGVAAMSSAASRTAPPAKLPPSPPASSAQVQLPARAPAPPDRTKTKTPTPTDAGQEVGKALRDWAAAWARQDVDAYLACYAPGFKTPGGMRRKTWEAERRNRISRPSWIKVDLADAQTVVEGDRATVRVRQSYRASNFKGDSSKTLVFVRSGDRWLILEETAR
ncbi:MAG: tetratricopeptide repeat protein [Zoogloeaceae bacterium]|jgi:tetratricopeptide (TPR) repeat protein|nr:tetratricopeptide repeat protein [Zoogloeaceae bacterium]